jgi:hypothetical protein
MTPSDKIPINRVFAMAVLAAVVAGCRVIGSDQPTHDFTASVQGWPTTSVEACFGPPTGSETEGELVRQTYAAEGCTAEITFHTDRVVAAKTSAGEQQACTDLVAVC